MAGMWTYSSWASCMKTSPEARLVAVHQPNFLPWLGFFDKLARSDVFVLLDSVQFPKKGGSWTNRVQILVGGSAHWMTVPIVRSYHGTRAILDMRIDETTNWRGHHLAVLRHIYERAEHFHDVFPLIESIIGQQTDLLAEYNIQGIFALCEAIGIRGRSLCRSSELKVCGNSTDLLINITKAIGGNAYVTGGGAVDYLDVSRFAQTGIELVHQDFRHPAYPQLGAEAFVPGLSIVDALMNCGFHGVRTLLTGEEGKE